MWVLISEKKFKCEVIDLIALCPPQFQIITVLEIPKHVRRPCTIIFIFTGEDKAFFPPMNLFK